MAPAHLFILLAIAVGIASHCAAAETQVEYFKHDSSQTWSLYTEGPGVKDPSQRETTGYANAGGLTAEPTAGAATKTKPKLQPPPALKKRYKETMSWSSLIPSAKKKSSQQVIVKSGAKPTSEVQPQSPLMEITTEGNQETRTPQGSPSQEQVTGSATTSTASHKLPSVTVGVPVFPRDFAVLPRLLKSIAAQGDMPLEILIAASETTADEGEKLRNELIKKAGLSTDFSRLIKVLAASDKQLAGKNRNRILAAAKGDLVSLIDADDEMHPEKLQLMRKLFATTDAKCALHSFAYASDRKGCLARRNLDIDNTAMIKGKAIYKATRSGDSVDGDGMLQVKPEGIRIEPDDKSSGVATIYPHHGHPTCRKNAYLEVGGFDGDMERGQDSAFLRSVLRHYGPDDDSSIVAINLPLTIYYPSQKSQEEFPDMKGKDVVDKTKNVIDNVLDSASSVVNKIVGGSNAHASERVSSTVLSNSEAHSRWSSLSSNPPPHVPSRRSRQ